MSQQNIERPVLDWMKSPAGIFEVYANSMHVTWSLDDVRLRLGQTVNNPETPNPGPKFVGIVQERAGVTISWRQAKILRNQLDLIINSYESVNGTINVEVKLPSGT